MLPFRRSHFQVRPARYNSRIAASDPRLWTAILANAGPVVKVLKDIRGDLDDLIRTWMPPREGALEGGSVELSIV